VEFQAAFAYKILTLRDELVCTSLVSESCNMQQWTCEPEWQIYECATIL